MTADECEGRAQQCAANASRALTESVSLEFLQLAAQWRAIAVRQIFLGHLDDPAEPMKTASTLAEPYV